MFPRRNPGRVTGFLYLLLLPAALRLVYIPAKLFVTGSPSATAANIAAHERLFRLGMVTDLFTGTMVIFVALAFYRLFKSVNQHLAVLMVILGALVVAPIYFMNVLNDVAALILARGASILSAFDEPQRDALVMLFIKLHHHGVLANEIFWGLWLFPMGMLIYRSGFMPRFLGVWLIINGVAYLALSLTGFLLPVYEDTVELIALPAQLGELATMLWLLIKGATPPWDDSESAPA